MIVADFYFFPVYFAIDRRCRQAFFMYFDYFVCFATFRHRRQGADVRGEAEAEQEGDGGPGASEAPLPDRAATGDERPGPRQSQVAAEHGGCPA